MKQVIKKIKTEEVEFPQNKFVSESFKSFIKALMRKNSRNRLGNNGVSELLSHEWLKDIDIEEIKKKTVIPSFIPEFINDYDMKYVDVS